MGLSAKNSKGKISKSYPERVNEFYDNIPADLIVLWVETYKDKDVEYLIGESKSWLLTNPNKRRKNFKSFTNNWLKNDKNEYRKTKKVTKPKNSLDFKLFKEKWLFDTKLNEEKTKSAWYELNVEIQKLVLKILPHSMKKYKMELDSGKTELEYISQAHKYISEKKYDDAKLLEVVKRREWLKKEEARTRSMRTPEQEELIRKENAKWREE